MPTVAPLHKAVFKNSIIAKRESYRIPTLEMALALEFAAMVSPHRAYERKQQDGVDFLVMTRAKQNQIKLEHAAELGELVYTGGGSEILKLIADAKAGKRLDF